MSDIIILGGPNGAGKTTAAPSVLPPVLRIREFVNADEIARGISPFNPQGSAIAAGRLLVERIHALAEARARFAFETTCAGRAHVPWLRACRSAGYRITLVFLWLPSPQAALARVARRVRQGGHSVPDATVIQRYSRGLRNMRHLYLPLADLGLIYDNSDAGRILIAESTPAALRVHDREHWNSIEEATQ